MSDLHVPVDDLAALAALDWPTPALACDLHPAMRCQSRTWPPPAATHMARTAGCRCGAVAPVRFTCDHCTQHLTAPELMATAVVIACNCQPPVAVAAWVLSVVPLPAPGAPP